MPSFDHDNKHQPVLLRERKIKSDASPHVTNSMWLSLLKLVVGALAFLILCGLLIFMVFPVGRLLNGDISLSSIAQLLIVLFLISSISAALYLLARKPRSEREALAGNFVANQFARQKLYLQLSSLGLIAIAILGMIVADKVFPGGEVVSYAVISFVFLGYWVLARRLWRCPACGYRLSFYRTHHDTQTISNCPACHIRLQ